ncbi:MAG: domain S-box-containing protein [Rubritepida sp.]|nr:domain S-box-containing protein [Rubritepida sp.]
MPLALRAFLGLLLALVPAGLVQILLEQEARQERTEQLGQQATRYVRLLARQQAGIVEAARQLLSTMAAHDAIRADRPSAECDAFLARIVAANPRYVTANLFSPAGDNICSAQPALIRVANVGDRPYLRAVMRENRFQIGEYAVGRGTGAHSLHFSAPLRDGVGNPVGVVVVALSIPWLVQDLQSLALPPGGVSTIADRNGLVLARSAEAERYVGQPVPPLAMTMLHQPEPGLYTQSAADGVKRIAAYMPASMEPEGLFIEVGLESERQMGAAAYADRRAALMIIGSLLLTFVLALLGFHATIERPVQRLLAAAQRWSAQDWGARVGAIGGGREFERLASAFDSMAETVQTREAAQLRATTRMQAVLRVAPQIVLSADPEGRVDWTNDYWQQTTGLDNEASLGDGWLSAVHPDDREGAGAAWHAALAGALLGDDAPFTREVRLRRAADKSWRWYLLTGAPIHDPEGHIVAWTAVGVDFHERRQAQAETAATAAQLRATYENAPVGLCLLDRQMRFVAINEMLAQTDGAPAAAHIGRGFGEMSPQVAAELEPAIRRVLETGQPIQEFELRVKLGGEERYWLCSYYPVRGREGEVTGVSGAVIDITARKRIEASERMLSREVDHRAQNALSVVRGLVRLTAAESTDDMPAMVEVLEGRIGAMSRAHNVLSREKWVGADLREIVQQELASHPGRTQVEGPPLRLIPDAAQPLTLVLHELLTNAAKYGGLSTLEGRVTVRWERRAEGVILQWIERHGPRLAGPPPRTSFGTMLIDANMRGQLAGGIERYWDAEGLRCILTIGNDAVAGSTVPGTLPGAGPLTGRRVLVAEDDPVSALTFAAALREGGCEVVGPATTVEEALHLLEKAGSLDAAVLAGTLQGRSVQPVAQLLQRRTVAILYLSPLGVPAEDLAETTILDQPITPRSLRETLAAALQRGREDGPGST